MGRRVDRINSLLRQQLSELVQLELKDPRLSALVTITRVQISSDLQTAKVFVSVLGDQEERDDVLKVMTSARGFLRHALRDRLDLRFVPDLLFISDTSIEEGTRVLDLMNRVAPPPPPKPS
ncbi:MAG: 30S ribosome-binding factor RbfA [Dehalococcoidia bacterium]|nr:30S ribosome-binding factor RbfA [Dehalococcoidia bacterium]